METMETMETAAAVDTSDSPEYPDYDDDDDEYQTGKAAAERRVETGFMSRLFSRPRRN